MKREKLRDAAGDGMMGKRVICTLRVLAPLRGHAVLQMGMVEFVGADDSVRPYEVSGGNVPYPWLPPTRGLSPKVTGGETDALLQPLRSIVSPSVMTFGHDTALVRGRLG